MPRRTSSWLTVLQLCLSSLLLLARARVPVTEHTDQDIVSRQTRRLQVPVHGKGGSGGSKTCMAEDQCIDKHCGKGYDHTSSKFPYSINYTKWSWPGEDVFDFRVCVNQCNQDDHYCEPLQSWSLRLDTDLVTNAGYVRKVEPEGRLITECEETGLGYRWEGAQLGSLHTHPPSNGHRCEKFLMTVKHDPHMAGHYWLSDICQQRIDIVATKNGKTMFSQTSVVVAKDKFSDIGSCLIHFQTEGGSYGFTLLEDWEFVEKDVRPAENIPDLAGNPNDPFDITRRRLLEAEKTGHGSVEHLSPGIHGAAAEGLPGPGIPSYL